MHERTGDVYLGQSWHEYRIETESDAIKYMADKFGEWFIYLQNELNKADKERLDVKDDNYTLHRRLSLALRFIRSMGVKPWQRYKRFIENDEHP